MPIVIKLTEKQLQAAEAEAVRRQTENEAKGLRGRNRAPAIGDKALRLHRLGCIGEIAAASFLGLSGQEFLLKDAVRDSSDLPGNLEVKTRPRHDYDLLIQIDDDPGKIFVLITHDGHSTQVAGWIRGHDAMKREWIKEYVKGRPCYAVKQSALRSPETLGAAIQGPQPRILGFHEAWLSAGDDDQEDLVLHFDFSLLEELGWEIGDTLVWDIDPNSQQCVIRKASNERTENQAISV